MQIGGVLPPDAPDPRRRREEMLARMPIPAIEFATQPSVECVDYGVGTVGGEGGFTEVSVTVSSTLWHNPADKSDAVNLADLDDATRESLEEVPPWPRLTWLVDHVERMRYPMLWEAVRTTWNRNDDKHSSVEAHLVSHTNYILMNQFREQLGLDMRDWDSPALASPRVIRHGVPLSLNGREIPGKEIDTDPFVYAIGAKLPDGGTLTAVVAREHLPYLALEFAHRPSS